MILAYLPIVDSPENRCKTSSMGAFGTKKATAELQNSLRVLESKVEDMDRAIRGLHTEWIEFYDKTSRAMSRMAKRYAIDKRENGEEIPEDGTDSPSDSYDPISEKIHARRARGFLAP